MNIKKNKHYVYIDFEFFGTEESNLTTVACSLMDRGSVFNYFLLDNQERVNLKRKLNSLQGAIFVAYNAVAEARSFYSLGLDPLKFNWIDLMIEWRNLTNRNKKYSLGEHYVKGEIVEIKSFNADDKGKQTDGLASCIYKLLGFKIDTDNKNAMRDLILSRDLEALNARKKEILEYCESDIIYLEKLLHAFRDIYVDGSIKQLYDDVFTSNLKDNMLLRGKYAARTAVMESLGYPVNVEWMTKLGEQIPKVIRDIQTDINEQFPDYPLFNFNSKTYKVSLNKKTLTTWIENHEGSKWPRTPGGEVKTDMKTIDKKWGKFNYTYPRNNFRAQYVRYAKALADLKSFDPKNTRSEMKDNIYNYLGSDNRIRPYLNPYGSQTSRSQPKATAFIMAKSSWLRSLVQPLPGKCICGIDYSSQEFLLSALVSGDKNMVEAYKSGDVYLAFAKAIKLVPEDGTRDKYKAERNLCKAAVLGMSYSMGSESLAKKMKEDTGDELITNSDGQGMIDSFAKSYPALARWKLSNERKMARDKYLSLPDGWTLYSGQDNFRSINNFPIQGLGAVIMRRAVATAQDKGCDVIMTLHDSIYIELSHGDWEKMDILKDAMLEATRFYCPEGGEFMRVEGVVWGPDFKEEHVTTPSGFKLDAEVIHVEEKGLQQWKEYKYLFNL